MTLHQAIDQIEGLQLDDLTGATKLLRSLLFKEGHLEEAGSFGDALANLAKTNSQHRNVAAAVIRFLAVQNIGPEPNAKNQIARSIVEIAMGSLPDLCNFLGLSAGSQTYQNFTILKGAHERICSLLSPIILKKSSLELFLAARHPIIQCLHHSAVEAYCAPFGLATVVDRVEQIFSLVRKISTSDQIALNHQIKLFQSTVDEYTNLALDRNNFLTTQYLLPFLESASLTVESFLAETRGRFSAAISMVLAHDNSLQKHYPLQEEREFTVIIPLRNGGPGTALNVQAELTHNEEQIITLVQPRRLSSARTFLCRL